MGVAVPYYRRYGKSMPLLPLGAIALLQCGEYRERSAETIARCGMTC